MSFESQNGVISAEEVGRIPPETVFGQPTRPCTPVFDLIEHKYQQKWLADRREQEILSRARSKMSKVSNLSQN